MITARLKQIIKSLETTHDHMLLSRETSLENSAVDHIGAALVQLKAELRIRKAMEENTHD